MATLDLAFLNSPNFRLRVLSALVLVPLALAGVWAGGWVFSLMVFAGAGLALREWMRLVDPEVPHAVAAFAYVALFACILLGAVGWVVVSLLVCALSTLALYGLQHHAYGRRYARWFAFGLPYLACSSVAFIALRAVPDVGLGLALYALGVVWGTDIGGYMAGRLIGGPKILPYVSPNKSWAGLFGGMALAALLGYAVAVSFGARQIATAVWLALLLAVIGQWGDFFKSYFKRRAGVKESGGLIPGHGGVLDRIDGLIPTCIFLALFHATIGNAGGWW